MVGNSKIPAGRKSSTRAILLRIAAISILVGQVTSCDRPPERTPVEKWQTKTFSREGVVITLPSESKVNHHPAFGVSVSLHPDPPPLFRLADTSYLIHIHAERRKTQEIADELVLYKTSSNQFQKWFASLHPVISAIQEQDYSYYRYDVPCVGDELLRVNAEVHHRSNASAAVWLQDDRIVRRILGSVECVSAR